MAFFKFRLPGQAPAAAADAQASPGDSVEVVRRRARHRLLGAVVLVFVAVVAFPLIFDSQPRPVAVDTPIVIPDRQSTSPLTAGQTVPAAQTPAKPLLPPVSATVPAEVSLEPGREEAVASSLPASTRSVQEPATPSSSPAVPKSDTAPSPVSLAESQDKSSAKAVDDGHKAKALLEGKSPADRADKVVIQVGAFGDADKVREVRRKLEQAGLKTYTQILEGKDGKRTTRVRVGPFDSHAEAEKAAARVRKLDLPANLINL